MSRMLRGAFIALVSFVSLMVVASTASASGTGPVRINTAATTATSTNSVLSVLTASGVRTVRCASFVIGAAITTAGAVSIPANSATFTGCTFSGVVVNITQPRAWTGTIRHLDSAGGDVAGITLDITVPSGGVAFSGAGCTFTLRGAALGDFVFPTPVAHGVLTNVSGINFPASLRATLGLIVENPSALCGFSGIANGNLSAFSANFSFAPVVNGAGI
jgi:hypothetical protein